uniref:Uncharacterized protein n=1 Tax=Triticum urartu TaxID=4572 RepID=A0A8R7UW09_TRIUA
MPHLLLPPSLAQVGSGVSHSSATTGSSPPLLHVDAVDHAVAPHPWVRPSWTIFGGGTTPTSKKGNNRVRWLHPHPCARRRPEDKDAGSMACSSLRLSV